MHYGLEDIWSSRRAIQPDAPGSSGPQRTPAGRARSPGVGSVENWVEPMKVRWPLVTFRWTYRFAMDGQVLTSDSTLRFRRQEEIELHLLVTIPGR